MTDVRSPGLETGAQPGARPGAARRRGDAGPVQDVRRTTGSPVQSLPGTPAVEGTIERFTPTERAYHWVQAIPYLVCLVTGTALLLLADGRHLAAREGAAAVHRWAGAAMLVGIGLVGLLGDRRPLLENARIALRWSRDDLLWLWRYPLAENGRDVEVPPVGKFNPGQKLNLLGQMLLVPLLGATGLVMWFSHGVLLPWFAHVVAFAVAVPLVLGHGYLALIHRSTRKGLPGVFGGRVDRAWAVHHYPLWVRDEDARRELETREAALLAEVRSRLHAEDSAP